MKRDLNRLLLCIIASFILIVALSHYKNVTSKKEENHNLAADFFSELVKDTSTEDPLKYLDENFQAAPGFQSNLPLVVLRLDEELAEYKKFSEESEEIVFEDVEPWTNAQISLYETKDGVASIEAEPTIKSAIKIKKRGHTSISFDKPQYYIKLVNDAGEENPQDILGMGAEDAWILNGSMADKSMLRNYLAYQTAAKIMEYAPKCHYCEVLTEEDGVYTYQGVYLMMDSVKKSENRVNIDSSSTKNVYTSYLVRRDRLTYFDTMLDTYGRKEGFDEGYIGVKYPALANQTKANLDYIAQDFSKVEKIIYSPRHSVFLNYPNYIDVDTFVDYFIVNEFFGNYDAGEHSTYMYKNSGGKLKIGPVWDFDQAMNNSVVDETDPLSLAMQEKTFYKQLFQDKVFINKIKKRYANLQTMYLNDAYMFAAIDEIEEYLASARVREWYRWAADYLDGSGKNRGNYYLRDYEYNGEVISRFNDDYSQEIYNIKVYLSKHASVIQQELTKQKSDASLDSGVGGSKSLWAVLVCILFVIPSILINRR